MPSVLGLSVGSTLLRAKKLEGKPTPEVELLMVSDMVVVCVTLPNVPETVTVEVPVAAVELAVNVRVLKVLVLVGLNAAVTPAGSPVAESATAPENDTSVTVTVALPAEPD